MKQKQIAFTVIAALAITALFIPAAFAEDADLLGHVGSDRLRRPLGQQRLLVDGTPEGDAITELVLQLLGVVTGNVGLDRVEDIHADIGQVTEDGGRHWRRIAFFPGIPERWWVATRPFHRDSSGLGIFDADWKETEGLGLAALPAATPATARSRPRAATIFSATAGSCARRSG